MNGSRTRETSKEKAKSGAAWFGYAHHRLLWKTKPEMARRPIQKPVPPARVRRDPGTIAKV